MVAATEKDSTTTRAHPRVSIATGGSRGIGRANAQRLIARDDAGSVRRWRPATMPEVEVVECHQALMAMEGIEQAYTLSLKTEVTHVTRVRYRRDIHDCTDAIALMEPGEAYTVFPTELGVYSRVLVLQPAFVSRIALQYCGRENDTHRRLFSAHTPSLGKEMLAIIEALPELSGLEANERLTHLVGTLIAQFAEPVARRRQDDLAATAGLGRARELLHARSSEAVTLEELVRAAECGTVQRLIRGFRSAFGFTPHQYLTHLRLQQARHLLRRGHDCGKTARAVGFYDQSQLNRHFVKYLGVTPGAYARAVI